MNDVLDGKEWAGLLRMVFAPGAEDRSLAILVDVPDANTPDTDAWR